MADPMADPKSVWLRAWREPSGGKAKQQQACFIDLSSNGDVHLAIAGEDSSFRLFRGTELVARHAALGRPVALAAVYPEASTPRVPFLVVASGGFLFIYRSLRPYLKLTLRPTQADPLEEDVWAELGRDSGEAACGRACERLAALRAAGVPLSDKSEGLLAAEPAAREGYALARTGAVGTRIPKVTCMEAVRREAGEEDRQDALSNLLVGSDAPGLLVMGDDADSAEAAVPLPSAPVLLRASGALRGGRFVIAAACRDRHIHIVKARPPSLKEGGALVGSIALDAPVRALALAPGSDFIFAACRGGALHAYRPEGARAYSLQMPAAVTCLEAMEVSVPVPVPAPEGGGGGGAAAAAYDPRAAAAAAAPPPARPVWGLLVALASGEVRLYCERRLVDSGRPGGGADDPPLGLRFGRYGRAEAALAVLHRSGALSLQVLSRHADLGRTLPDEPPAQPPPDEEEDGEAWPISVPPWAPAPPASRPRSPRVPSPAPEPPPEPPAQAEAPEPPASYPPSPPRRRAPRPALRSSAAGLHPAPEPPKPPSLPPCADVRQWKEHTSFAPAFSYTNGPALLALTDGALREMGVAHAGARHRILSEAAALASPAAPPPRHGAPGPAAAADGKRWDLFLSYAHADAAVVFLYADALEAAGFAVWVDRELKAGQRWMAKIGEAMNLCCAFLFFLSPAYVASKNCDDELQYAHHQLRLPKFPVWIADPKAVDLPVDYRMMLASVNWVQQRGGEVAAAVDAACWELFDGLRAARLPGPAPGPGPGPAGP
eukprot:tig00020902_g15010.t1